MPACNGERDFLVFDDAVGTDQHWRAERNRDMDNDDHEDCLDDCAWQGAIR